VSRAGNALTRDVAANAAFPVRARTLNKSHVRIQHVALHIKAKDIAFYGALMYTHTIGGGAAERGRFCDGASAK
jgi:hypothetical protein